MPRLRWWRDDKVLSTLAPVDDGSRMSLLDLRISKLTRDYNEVVYSCTADNTGLVPPLRTNVQIQMYCEYKNSDFHKIKSSMQVAKYILFFFIFEC